jgi:hypothetical protein
MPILIIAVAVAGCVGPQVPSLEALYRRMSDKDLWYSMRWTGAFNELRCRGLNPKLAEAEYDRRFGDRERAIDAAMIAKYGPVNDGEGEAILTGKSCRGYQGAIDKSEAIRAELERRLGLPVRQPIR